MDQATPAATPVLFGTFLTRTRSSRSDSYEDGGSFKDERTRRQQATRVPQPPPAADTEQKQTAWLVSPSPLDAGSGEQSKPRGQPATKRLPDSLKGASFGAVVRRTLLKNYFSPGRTKSEERTKRGSDASSSSGPDQGEKSEKSEKSSLAPTRFIAEDFISGAREKVRKNHAQEAAARNLQAQSFLATRDQSYLTSRIAAQQFGASRNPTPDTRSPTPETRHPKPDTRNPKPNRARRSRGSCLRWPSKYICIYIIRPSKDGSCHSNGLGISIAP